VDMKVPKEAATKVVLEEDMKAEVALEEALKAGEAETECTQAEVVVKDQEEVSVVMMKEHHITTEEKALLRILDLALSLLLVNPLEVEDKLPSISESNVEVNKKDMNTLKFRQRDFSQSSSLSNDKLVVC
jgi:hypothetical protein